MRLSHSVKTAYTSLRTNLSRSLLTVLGIVIGITSIILVMAIGQGARNLILGEINGLGADSMIVLPKIPETASGDFASGLFADSIGDREIAALKKKSNVPNITDIMPEVAVPGTVSYQSETYGAQVVGGDAEFYARSFDIYPSEGAVFDQSDIEGQAAVAVIGSKVADELFGNIDPLGKYIKIHNKRFRVVGVLPQKGQVVFFNVDNLVIVPYTTARTYLLGIDYYNDLIVKVDDKANVDQAVSDIKLTLRELHHITDPEKDDFEIHTQQGLVEQVGIIITALTLFLSAVVAISLVVAGVGLMNIVLVSVTERTREIGLRKALGATDRDIMMQFLIESVMLTLLGGVIGIMLGSIFAYLASIIITSVAGLDWQFVFPFGAAVLGLMVSAIVGIVFGLYPARQAAKKSPIEALRYE